MSHKTRIPLWRGLTATMLSMVCVFSLGYSIADTWRSTVDSVLGTKSYITNTEDLKYQSTYSSATDLMNAAKELAIREGAEGTVIMKNDNDVFPLSKSSTVSLWGSAAYNPYMSAAGNTDQVKLLGALQDAGFSVNETLETIYEKLMTYTTTSGSGWSATTAYTYGPNKTAGDYLAAGYQIVEADPATDFTGDGGAAADWKDNVNSDVGIVVFCRPGGEGTTYRPGIARDSDGNTLDQNPLAFSPEELNVVKYAKETCDKVIVLLNTSCTFEVGPLVSGDYAVDGIAYIGIPNDYQFTGIVQALDGDVNPTGALADTYATSSTSSPAMMNFGGDYYSDYATLAANSDDSAYDDPRWSGVSISNVKSGSFGGTVTYSGGLYIVEAEDIYTGYNYYETRYYDGVLGQGDALSSAGVTQGETSWNYADEVCYPFGYGLSYLSYEETLESVKVEDRSGGEITATVAITNEGASEGEFLGQLYVQTPYTDYDKTNKVEKTAVQFLSSGKVTIGAGETKTVEITIPTKYIASYDYTTAKTYILDGGIYYFTTGNGSHDALNNILAYQGKTGDAEGNSACVKTWSNGEESVTDTTTFAVSDSGAKITNVVDDADLNYYLPGTVTYLSRDNWNSTYPVNYNTVNNGSGVTVADSSKSAEWTANLRNQQYTIQSGETVSNVDGIAGPTFADITYDEQTNINDPFWDNLVNAIPVDEAVGAVAHGGSQSDTLSNIDNPIVKQYDGPTGFSGKSLSTNNGEEGTDPYYVDSTTTEGAFKPCINSQTLLGSSFNPELAYEWGELLGNTGLWIGCYQIWGAALNYHRTPYNGRNTEYHSEDPMLCNVIGEAIIRGSKQFGIIVGPKHIGFNDQEYDRSGVCVYLNEQKFRQTDIRGFQGAIEDAGALGMMIAFNRIGATNASHSVGMIKGLFRGEWNFQGLVSTDMMNNAYYFNAESSIIATVTQIADFAGNNSTIGGEGGSDATWAYLTLDAAKNDATLVTAARQCMKYQLYAFANSAILNISTTTVVPAWETVMKTGIYTSAALAACTGVMWLIDGIYFGIIKSKKEVA
jgi:beta-glucosidase